MPYSAPHGQLGQLAILASTCLLAACGGGGDDAPDVVARASQSVSAAMQALPAAPTNEAISLVATPAIQAPETLTSILAADSAAPPFQAAEPAAAAARPTATILSAGGPILAAAIPATGRIYYVDSRTGNDSSNGTSVGTSWKTLAKVAGFALAAGDQVRLACGAVWRETLKVNASGTVDKPISLVAYPDNCATPPVIDGSVVIPTVGWSQYKGSIYRASLAVEPTQLNSSTGAMTWAHHPNRGADAAMPASVFARVAVDSDNTVIAGRAASTFLTTGADLKLPPGAAITTGTTVRIRTNSWVIDETTAASVAGAKLGLAKPTSYPLKAGWGYYLLGQLWMLDSPGEWYYDRAAKVVYAWMPNSAAPSADVAAGYLPAAIDLEAKQNVQVYGLKLRLAGIGINMRRSTNVVVRNTQIEDMSGMGIDASASKAGKIESNVINRTGNDAISTVDNWSSWSYDMRIAYNRIGNSGVTYAGETQVSLPNASFGAIRSGIRSQVIGNVIDNAGNHGIVTMSASLVNGNYIRGTCSVVDDCGAIYTAGAGNNSTFSNNIGQTSRGAVAGKAQASAFTQAQGIYLDESASGVVVTGNTMTDADNGIQIHVGSNNRVVDNKFYGNRNNQIYLQETRNRIRPTGDTFGNVIVGNQVVPTAANAVGFLQSTSVSNTDLFAQYDRNKYFDRITARIGIERSPANTREYTLPLWKQATTVTGTPRNQDPNAHASSEQLVTSYLITGANLVPNSKLETDAKGWKIWNATAPYGTFVREACASGFCARYTGGASPGILSSPFFSVVKDQWYRMSVDITTGVDNQRVSFVVRRNGGGTNGYEAISNTIGSFTGSTMRKRYTFVFKAIKTVNVKDPVTLDNGVSVDFDQVSLGKMVSVGNLELVPITALDSTTRTDLLLNASAAPMSLDCPARATAPASCTNYSRFSDDTPVVWPLYLPAFSSEIVYTLNRQLSDSDGDGISDTQDNCPGTPAGVMVNAAGCSIN
jgi:parallel beta-helix repeat protein